MLNAKLILVEGLPGAGKTTSSEHLGRVFLNHGIACRWYLEGDDPHPIDCSKLKLKDLAKKLPPLWSSFVERALQENIVAIIESRLWQNTLLFMLMSEYSVDEIVEVHQLVCKELTPLSPVLIYLYQDDIDSALNRLYTFRSETLIEKDIKTTIKYKWFQSRGLKDMNGWVQFFKGWQVVAEHLYRDWPFRKTKIENPHDDWEIAYHQMNRFLQVSQDEC